MSEPSVQDEAEIAREEVMRALSLGSPIHVCRASGLGDILMCTPALREIKRINHRCQIHFYTNFPDLVHGLPYIDQASLTAACDPKSLKMRYERSIPSCKHLAKLLGESIGVHVNDVRPDCAVEMGLVDAYRSAWNCLPRPHILVQRQAGPWTRNKDWPNEYWERLIKSLLKWSTVIEIGSVGPEHTISESPNHLDLRGNSRNELVASVAAADVLIAPDSGPIHIAAAVRTPAVVIMGGYLIPENTAYAENKVLYTPLPCSPCWLRPPCPVDRECLKKIVPEEVAGAVMEIWNKRQTS